MPTEFKVAAIANQKVRRACLMELGTPRTILVKPQWRRANRSAMGLTPSSYASIQPFQRQAQIADPEPPQETFLIATTTTDI